MATNNLHMPNLAVALVEVISQLEVAWFLGKVWKYQISRGWFVAISWFLYALWFATAAGIVLDLMDLQYGAEWFSPRIGDITIAAGTLWAFNSAIAVNVYAVYRFVNGRMTGKTGNSFSPGRRQALQTVTAAAIAAPFAVTGFGVFIERKAYVVKEIDFPIPNLHPDLAGLRIAQISDLHVSPFLSVQEAGRVVDMTNELRPQLTLVTGDLITQMGDPLDGTIRELARLRADAGVFGCLGNHEIYAKCEAYTTSECARAGIRFLRQQAVPLQWGNGTLNMAGVDFQRFKKKKHYLPRSEQLLMPGATNLLLSHNPDVFPTAVRKGYDAVVGGHTHGGQVTVEIINQTANLARFFTPFVAGLYRLDGRSCYVNSGIGTIGMPMRFGAPPEITFLRLRRA